MDFPADRVAIGAGGGDEEKQRLQTGIAGSLGHDIVKIAARLGVKLIKDHRVYVESVLGVGLRRQHLIKTVRRFIHQTFD